MGSFGRSLKNNAIGGKVQVTGAISAGVTLTIMSTFVLA